MERYMSIIYRHGRMMQERNVKELHLSGAQIVYLKDICESPGISQEQISQNHRIDKGAVAKAIKRMVELEYIRRENNPDDGRAYKLYPTDRALEIHKKNSRCLKEMKTTLLEGLEDEEVRELKRLLGKVAKNMDKLIDEQNNKKVKGDIKD